jgi:hypothetical protein
MSVFQQYGRVSGGGGFPVADAGEYLCRLAGVDVKQFPSFDDKDVLEDKFVWTWHTVDATDDQGKPYEFGKVTGVNFGNDKAGLTILLDKMMGRRISQDEFKSLDVEELKRQKWIVTVEEVTNAKGYAANRFVSVRKPKSAQTPPPQRPTTLGGLSGQPPRRNPAPEYDENDGLDDPFAE